MMMIKKKEEEYRALLLLNDNKMRRGILLVVAVSFTLKRERDLSSDVCALWETLSSFSFGKSLRDEFRVTIRI